MKYCSTDSPSRKLAVIGCSMTSPEGFDIRPRMPASWRTCSREPRAPESAIRLIGLNSPLSRSTSRISRNISSETFSVTRCQMSMILLCRSPEVMTPAERWFSISYTSFRAWSRIAGLRLGTTMSSTPKEMPARVAYAKVTSLISSSICTVASLPSLMKQ